MDRSMKSAENVREQLKRTMERLQLLGNPEQLAKGRLWQEGQDAKNEVVLSWGLAWLRDFAIVGMMQCRSKKEWTLEFGEVRLLLQRPMVSTDFRDKDSISWLPWLPLQVSFFFPVKFLFVIMEDVGLPNHVSNFGLSSSIVPPWQHWNAPVAGNPVHGTGFPNIPHILAGVLSQHQKLGLCQ